MQEAKSYYLSRLPSVDELLNQPTLTSLLEKYPRPMIVEHIRDLLKKKRQLILAALSEEEMGLIDCSLDRLLVEIKESMAKAAQFSLRRVINGTGVVLHTNLGRAVLGKEVMENILAVTSSYSNLEYDLLKGERGSRYTHAEEILRRVTGAESSMIVNNNAAAVLIALDTLARGREVILSRGQLIEIGGSFRIPDVMAKSGAILKEVGTTNRTHLRDYEEAITENTALLLKVHTSNFKILGFTTEVSLEELVALGGRHQIPVMEDLGSGNFLDLRKYGLDYEPTVQEALKTGVDLMTFSGDKLLGGPQAGILLGKKNYIDAIKRNPLARALRIDKMTLAGLEMTLRLYLDETLALNSIPTLRMLTMPLDEVNRRANRLLRMVKKVVKNRLTLQIASDFSEVGAGALPLQKIPTKVLAVSSPHISTTKLEELFRHYHPPILGRLQRDQLLFDLRTILDSDFSDIIKAFADLDSRMI